MSIHPEAGKLPDPEKLIRIPELMAAYYTGTPDAENPSQRVSFGTSGHRGSSFKNTFNEAHIYAVTQAVCDCRAAEGVTGPLFLGMDTHALSEAAYRTALEVLVANGVTVCVSENTPYTPTPAVSHAVLRWNAGRTESLADGIIITPSHNPPQDGGFKYNPPHGGPAPSDMTKRIESRANSYLAEANEKVRRIPYERARASSLVRAYDFCRDYVEDLVLVLDLDAVAASGLKFGVDPLGGASLPYWEPIAEKYHLNITVVNRRVDPNFSFVPCDKDGVIRMDCSSPWAMSSLLAMKDSFDLAFACDPDSDRHGIVTSDGLMNPNHYLAVAAEHLLQTRSGWKAGCGVGKTLVTSSMIDRVAASLGRRTIEVPVGFKWFVPYLHSGECGMGCEESAGASFLCFDGTPWSTDKDGPLMCLLAAEIMAKTGKSPSELYARLTERFGAPLYQRLDAPADVHTRNTLLNLRRENIDMKTLGGSAVRDVLTCAPGNGEAIGGVKVVTDDGWFAARPSGTEAICKVYTESFKGEEHLKGIQEDALAFMKRILS